MSTRYCDTLFRSRLEARWAAFFDLAGVGWNYEPEEKKKGWWPDFRISSVRFAHDGGKYSVLAEVKPVAFSPIMVDPAFSKALRKQWTLMLGYAPKGDYVGFLACVRGETKTIGVRLTEEGLEGAALGLVEYGSMAETLWSKANEKIPSAGVAAAINSTIEAVMGHRLFDFGEAKTPVTEDDEC